MSILNPIKELTRAKSDLGLTILIPPCFLCVLSLRKLFSETPKVSTRKNTTPKINVLRALTPLAVKCRLLTYDKLMVANYYYYYYYLSIKNINIYLPKMAKDPTL